MRSSLRFTAAAVVASALFSGVAAAQVPVAGISGAWRDAVPAGSATINNVGPTVTARWGVPASAAGQSGYNFAPSVLGQLPIGETFVLGTFNHLNFPVFAPVITSIFLDFDLELTGASTPSSFVSSYRFDHFETPNTPASGTCADGNANFFGVNVNGCADRVSFEEVSSPGSNFVFEGNRYFLQIVGFQSGGDPVSQFWTVENQENEAQLVAQLALVPEPGSLALLALGGLGFAAVRRRRRNA